MNAMVYRTSLRIENIDNLSMTVWIEPWGDDFTLTPKTSLLVTFDSEIDAPIDVQYTRDGLSVYSMRGGFARVRDEKREIWQCHKRIP
jgi:hypothetical protein